MAPSKSAGISNGGIGAANACEMSRMVMRMDVIFMIGIWAGTSSSGTRSRDILPS